MHGKIVKFMSKFFRAINKIRKVVLKLFNVKACWKQIKKRAFQLNKKDSITKIRHGHLCKHEISATGLPLDGLAQGRD